MKDIQEKFIDKCKEEINKFYDLKDKKLPHNIFVTWSSKVLQNCKALLGTREYDEYVECTYNGDKKVLYVDIYKKVGHEVIPFDIDK